MTTDPTMRNCLVQWPPVPSFVASERHCADLVGLLDPATLIAGPTTKNVSSRRRRQAT